MPSACACCSTLATASTSGSCASSLDIESSGGSTLASLLRGLLGNELVAEHARLVTRVEIRTLDKLIAVTSFAEMSIARATLAQALTALLSAAGPEKSSAQTWSRGSEANTLRTS